MTARPSTLAAALAATALLSCARGSAAPSPAAAPARAAAALSPEEALPGIALDGLSPAQREALAALAQAEYCPCGCPHTLSQCLREHKTCTHAPRAVRLAAKLAAAGATQAEMKQVVVEYYASFDERAKLEVASFGPPLGDPAAPITIVEFSDFTCPFCQLLRPTLERFVEEHPGRVKLVYKPFPIDSHPHAMDAAQAIEWARARGLFWKMHDAMFAQPHDLAPEDLVSIARQLGGDGDDLEKSLAGNRYRDRIIAAQNEARAAGLRGTPTLFFDGRRYTLPDYTAEMLQMTLEDEEEWSKARRWNRD